MFQNWIRTISFKTTQYLVIYYSRKRNPVQVRTRRQTTGEKTGDSRGEFCERSILPGLLMTEMLTFILSQQPLSPIKQGVDCSQDVSAALTPLEISCCAGLCCDRVYSRAELSIMFSLSRLDSTFWYYASQSWEEDLSSAIGSELCILRENKM